MQGMFTLPASGVRILLTRVFRFLDSFKNLSVNSDDDKFFRARTSRYARKVSLFTLFFDLRLTQFFPP